MPDTKRNSYGSIIKATGLFGGVKVFEIIIAIIRTKFVALLLGPSGMGIYGLISSPVNLIKSITSFGLGTSGVREVSKAYGNKDEYKKNFVVTILRKFVWLTGTLGLLVTFCMAKWLSQWSFGNTDYTLWFRLVSITLLIDQLVVGQKVLMQGTFHYSFLAKSTIIGNVVGLFVTIPLYYYFGVKGVVPVFVLHSLTSLFLSWYFSHKIDFKKVKLSAKEIIKGGSSMMKLGLAIALTGTVTLGAEYLLRLFISHTGDVADVGLFNAGMAMATQYIGVVLAAMASDYIPRLSAASSDHVQFNVIINRQLQLILIIVAPLVAIFILFIKEVVLLLYSTKFVPITGMIEWIMFGMFFRAVSFCLSYAVVAQADSKRFFLNELAANLYSLLFYVIGYRYFGFEGMGVAYCLFYLCYSVQMFFFCKLRYDFRFEKRSIYTIVSQMILVSVLLIISKLFQYTVYRYLVGAAWLILVICVAYRQLNSMINVKNALRALIEKRKNRHVEK